MIKSNRHQVDLALSACLTLQMLRLTPYTGMMYCPPPGDIFPFRWKAMILHMWNNGDWYT